MYEHHASGCSEPQRSFRSLTGRLAGLFPRIDGDQIGIEGLVDVLREETVIDSTITLRVVIPQQRLHLRVRQLDTGSVENAFELTRRHEPRAEAIVIVEELRDAHALRLHARPNIFLYASDILLRQQGRHLSRDVQLRLN